MDHVLPHTPRKVARGAFIRALMPHAALTTPGIFKPAVPVASLVAVTVFVSGTCQVLYLGRVDRAPTSADVLVEVTTGVATITWAEVAIYYGASTLNAAPASLARAGFTSVSGTFNTTGVKKTTVALSGVPPESELWAVLGSQATTPFQCRGALADELQSGVFNTVASRPSTTTPITPTIGGAAAVPAEVWAKVT